MLVRVPAENLQFDGIIRRANHAFESKPVILGGAFCAAVVAEHNSLGIPELLRHGLTLDRGVKITELGFHVSEGLVADGALVRRFFVFRIALSVDAMAARHED